MRSQNQIVGAVVKQLLQPNPSRTILIFRNLDPNYTLLVQSGDSPGAVADFFPVLPMEVLTLDPQKVLLEVIQGQWWGVFVASAATANTVAILGG